MPKHYHQPGFSKHGIIIIFSLVLLLTACGGGAATDDALPTVAVLPTSEEPTAEANAVIATPTAESLDAPPAAEAPAGEPATGSGQRVRFDLFGRVVSVELPVGWSRVSGNAMVIKEDMQTSGTAVLIPSSDSTAMSLEEAAESLVLPGESISSESSEANGRELLLVTKTDGGGNVSVGYYVRDSSGDVAILIIQPVVADPAALHQEVLFMAGNIEVE